MRFLYLIGYFLCGTIASAQTCTTNVALDQQATASTSLGGNIASYVTDGNMSTRWESAYTDPQNIVIDLGASYNLCKAIIRWEAAAGKNFTLEVSNDGAVWVLAATVINNLTTTNTFTLATVGRYVRMSGTARTSSFGYSIYEFEVYGVPVIACSSINLAASVAGTASSFVGGNIAAYAFDNNASTRWESAFSNSQFLYADLGSSHALCQVKLQWEAAYARDFDIQLSADALSWSTAYAYRGNVSLNNSIGISGNARYVRMNGVTRATGYGYSLYDFKIYGTNAVLASGFRNVKVFEQGGHAVLSWSNDRAVKIFDIERKSANGREDFLLLKRINAGDNISKYSWTDTTTLSGTYLYRIKEIGFSAQPEYSKVLVIQLNQSVGANIDCYYQRATGNIVIANEGSTIIKLIRVFNVNGQQISAHSENTGNRMVVSGYFNKGLVLIQLQSDRQFITKKLMIP